MITMMVFKMILLLMMMVVVVMIANDGDVSSNDDDGGGENQPQGLNVSGPHIFSQVTPLLHLPWSK